jgi:uncharacterized repeat protein (TIGR01451 family)
MAIVPGSKNQKNRSFRDDPSPWGEADDEAFAAGPEPRRSPTRAIVIFTVVALVVLLIGIGYYFVSRPKNVDVGLEFTKPNQVLVGQPFSVTVSYVNYSDTIIENVKLSLELPAGVSFVGQSSDQRVMAQATGDLGPGSVSQQTFNLIVLDGAQSLKHLDAKLLYSIPSRSTAQFESGSSVDVAVGQPAISLALATPDKVLNGEAFTVTVNYQNNSSQDLKNLRLHLDYPSLYKFTDSSVKADNTANTDWTIPALARNSGGSFTLSGSVVGPEQSVFTIGGSISETVEGQTYALATQTARISIAVAPLSLRIQLNDSDTYIARIGEGLRYTVTYTNDSSVTLANAVVSATLVGELFNFSTLRTDGSFSSLNNTITWNVSNDADLASIPPGAQGMMDFTVQLNDSFPARRLSDKNYVLTVNGRFESPTVPPDTAVSKTLSITSIMNKVAGVLKVTATGYFRDAASGILNTGPYPPRVNQPTQYTIHWKLANYATDVSGVTVSAFLQSGTTFTGTVKSTIDSMPTVDAATGAVTWQIPNLVATKGIIGGPVETIFQVQQTPAINQVGQVITLLGPTAVQAMDAFVNQSLTDAALQITTDLMNDPTLANVGDRRVQP